MENLKVLSGEELVAKGITKIDASLPEVGLKDVTPNGSWLEQKQIQAALEARKYLIEVERIEKNGTLSHAEWRDDLNLAEVTQKTGGHWQYLGHNVGKKLFLRPEEALFLMEVNALLLKHNEVTVSLQKAYSLLLNSSITLTQYSVYSSLSRLGYKVFRHRKSKLNDDKKSCHKNNTINDHKTEKVSTSESINPPKTKSEDETIDAKPCECTNSLIVNETINYPITVNICDTTNDTSNLNNELPVDVAPDDVELPVVVESQNMDVSVSNEDNSDTNEKVPDLNQKIVTKDVALHCNSTNDDSNKNIVEMESDDTFNTNDVDNTLRNDTQKILQSSTGGNKKEVNGVAFSEDTKVIDDNEASGMELCVDHSTLQSDTMQNVENITEKDDIPINDIENNSITCTARNALIVKRNENTNNKIVKLTNRKLKPSNSKTLHDYFENIPDLYKKQVVSVNVPEQKLLPKNIFVNNSSYLLNLQNIKKRSVRSVSTESATYTSSDEVNGINIRRIRSSSGSEFPQNPNVFLNSRFPRHIYFRPDGYWRPQNNLNYYQFNMFFQRNNFSNVFFQSRVQYLPRPNPFLRSFPYPNNLNPNISSNARKRMRNGRTAHLQNIKNLAVRLKQMLLSNNTDVQNLQALHSLLHSYNLRYKSRLRLTENFDIVNEEKIIETIELDDDEESKSKKSRLDNDDSDKFDENLYRLRQLALKLRDLEAKEIATASHKRAFSKAIKTFNKSFNADVYLKEDTYDVVDRRFITLESSSESDCVVEEAPKVNKRKKLRNPFNILKRRSERMKSLNNPGTSKEDTPDANKIESQRTEPVDNKYNKQIVEIFNETWLPNENDFGRAEVVPKQLMNMRLMESDKEQYLYEFMNDNSEQYNNWLEAKINFLKHLEETKIAFENEQARMLIDSDLNNVGLRPLIDSGNCSDKTPELEKIRIIKNNKDIDSESSLSIDFDVYNRDVQNFRKTSPPKPHFRVICIDESSSFPSAAGVMALHSKFEDNVAIVFAVVSLGSVMYLQINPTDLPVYIPRSDIV